MDIVVNAAQDTVNQFTQILIDMGCDVTVIPHNQFELGVLWIKYSWAVFLLGLGVKALLRAINGIVGGAGFR